MLAEEKQLGLVIGRVRPGLHVRHIALHLVAQGDLVCLVQQRVDEARRSFDLFPVMGRLRAREKILDHAVLERLVAKARPQGTIDACGDGARLTPPRVHRARVCIGAWIGFNSTQHPLGAGIQPIQVHVHGHRVHRPDPGHERRGDHLGAAPVLSLAGQEKTRIADKIHVAFMVVMIHPGG